MSLISYFVTFAVVVFCWYQGMVPGRVVGQFALFSIVLNGAFWVLIQSDFNLRFKDPSMTGAQMVLSLLPALWVMFHLDAGQARAAFLMIAMVPLLYGILALSLRQFLAVSLWFIALYGLLYLAIWTFKPHLLTGARDMVQTLAFVLVMAEMAIIGGFISGLRGKLRDRNRDLKAAMARIQELVNVDDLTGVYNRRRLFEVISEESSRYSRTPGSFSLCLLDIDHFKEVNDSYGHQAGDTILKTVAQCVANDLRAIDCFGRYGGEEFLIVLPQTPLNGASVKAERVRKAIEELRFPQITDALRISVSIGVAEYVCGENTDETLARADQALYRAKDSGRNQVITSAAPGPSAAVAAD
ncbi:GGDEF domain-containing protein [Marinobacter salicampi]|uniref:GGDEF domain-containing protein n=1 Tax=Marinobacter salicampi TaxID=435907 RepID=UPI00140C6E0E|nr:GGDEF domain-containing protein [Marinobacter salicampi]